MTLRVPLSAFVLCCLCAAANAQGPTIVVGPPSRFAQQIVERLHAGVGTSPDRADIRVDQTTSDCSATTTSESTHAAITITVDGDTVVHICVRTDAGVSARSVGPFPALDAASVEQIATVIEASLDAIRPAPATTAPVAVTTNEPPPELAPRAAPPASDAAPRHTAPAGTMHGHSRQSTAARASDQRIEPSRPYGMTFDYQLMVWNGDMLVHGMRVGTRRLVVASWLWLGGGLGVALPFQKAEGAIGATFWALTLDATIGVHLPLGPEVVLDVSVGPRIEWLSVSTFADQMAGANATRSGFDFSFGSVFALVPRFAVSSDVSIALGVGVILTHKGRTYAFDRGGSFVNLMDQSAPRPYLHVGAVLAL